MEISTTAPPSSTLSPEPNHLIHPNGGLKRHIPSPAPAIYKECMKNHAAARGGHAIDGCCEYMASPNTLDLHCLACRCHRNFHRKEIPTTGSTSHFTEYRPHHRHHPPPPLTTTNVRRSPDTHSPPPISSSYALVLNSGGNTTPFSRKRHRTKFSQEQKEKMLGFAEKIGWKMQRGIDDSVAKFCGEIGVERGVFKVWMHNHKNIFLKRDLNVDFGNTGNNGNTSNININNNNNGVGIGANGSSSS